MLIPAIDPARGVPVFEQISDALGYAIAAGDPKAGERLPSVRALAAQLGVNPNTVARAYRGLEAEGVIEAQRGLGMFVAPRAPQVCRRRREQAITRRIAAAVDEAVGAGIPARELRAITRKAIDNALAARRARRK
jgi:GntR family transcriptional regulator